MTQPAVADRLAQLTGHRLPQASTSATERGLDSPRRRRFDAHELYLLALVFDVPIAYFFTRPPEPARIELRHTRRPAADLCRALLATDDQLAAVDDRLADPALDSPEVTAPGTHDPAPHPGAEARAPDFRTWRQHRARHFERTYGDPLAEIANLGAQLAARLKARPPVAPPEPQRGPEIGSGA